MRSRICGTPTARRDFAHFLRNVVSAVIQNVGHIFHEHRQRRACLNILQIFYVKPRTGVMAERFRMIRHFARFRPPYAGKGLKGRATHNHIER